MGRTQEDNYSGRPANDIFPDEHVIQNYTGQKKDIMIYVSFAIDKCG
jgi:hypothetical protein